jgi:hypothetical protein
MWRFGVVCECMAIAGVVRSLAVWYLNIFVCMVVNNGEILHYTIRDTRYAIQIKLCVCCIIVYVCLVERESAANISLTFFD